MNITTPDVMLDAIFLIVCFTFIVAVAHGTIYFGETSFPSDDNKLVISALNHRVKNLERVMKKRLAIVERTMNVLLYEIRELQVQQYEEKNIVQDSFDDDDTDDDDDDTDDDNDEDEEEVEEEEEDADADKDADKGYADDEGEESERSDEAVVPILEKTEQVPAQELRFRGKEH